MQERGIPSSSPAVQKKTCERRCCSRCSSPATEGITAPQPHSVANQLPYLFHHLPSPGPLLFFFFFWLRLKDLTHLQRRKSPQSISTLSIMNKGLGRGRGRVAHCYWLKHFGKVIFKVWAFPFPLQAHLGPLGRNSWALLYFILGPLTLLRSNREGGEGGGGMRGVEEKMKTGGGKDKSLRDFKVEQRPIQMWIIARSAR